MPIRPSKPATRGHQDTPTIPLRGLAPPRTHHPSQLPGSLAEHKVSNARLLRVSPGTRLAAQVRRFGRATFAHPQSLSQLSPVVRHGSSPIRQHSHDRVIRVLDAIDGILDRPLASRWDNLALIRSLLRLRLWRTFGTRPQRLAFDDLYGVRLGLIRSAVEDRFAYLQSLLP